MRIAADATLPYPRPVVFAAYRDELGALLSYLPNVRAIDVKSRRDEGPKAFLVNVWRGGGEIPAVARSFVSEAMLSWDDHAVWDEDLSTCTWRIETHAFTEAVDCRGENRFVELGSGTRIEIRGELRIDAKKVRGVPSLLAGKVGEAVEAVLVGRIQPNLVEVTEGLRKHLAATHGR
jgi:hypothetical protein